MKKSELKKTLRKLYKEFEEKRFPNIYSTNEELASIRATLVDQDAYIAGLVTSYLQNEHVRKDQISVDEDLNKRVVGFKPTNDNENKTINEIEEYLKRLNKMIRILQKLLEEEVEERYPKN